MHNQEYNFQNMHIQKYSFKNSPFYSWFSILPNVPMSSNFICLNLSYLAQVWPSQTYISVFIFLSITIQYVIPSCIVAYAYTKIYLVFRASSKKVGIQKASSRILGNARRRRRTNTMLFLLSAVFFLSWAPLNIFVIILKTTNTVMVGNLDRKAYKCEDKS